AGPVLVIGSGQQLYRQYLIEGAARRRPLWLIDDHAAGWQRPYLTGSSVVGMLDSTLLIPDEPALLDAAAAVARSHHVSGVFTYDEPQVIATARIADQLGLPGLTTAGAERCRNKYETRLALTAAGLPQPRFRLADTAEDA